MGRFGTTRLRPLAWRAATAFGVPAGTVAGSGAFGLSSGQEFFVRRYPLSITLFNVSYAACVYPKPAFTENPAPIIAWISASIP